MILNRNLSGCQFFNPSDLPEDWDCVPLKERIELKYGKGLKEDNRKSGDVDVYGSNGKVGSHDIPLVNNPGIIIGRKGSIGEVHFAPRPFWAIDTAYYVVPKFDDDLRFLYHLLNFLPLASLNAATGVPGLSRRDVYALRGAFPPHPEQVNIADVLDAVDDEIKLTQAKIKSLNELKRSLMNDLLTSKVRIRKI